MNRLFGSSSSSQPAVYSFTLGSSTYGSDITNVTVEDAAPGSPPVYTIQGKDADYAFNKGGSGPASSQIGSATAHSVRPCVLILHGQTMEMKKNLVSGSFTIQTPTLGKLKWKAADQLRMGNFELKDQAGTRLAKYSSAGLPKPWHKKLDILVTCDMDLVELIIISAFISRLVANDVDSAMGTGVIGILGT